MGCVGSSGKGGANPGNQAQEPVPVAGAGAEPAKPTSGVQGSALKQSKLTEEQ